MHFIHAAKHVAKQFRCLLLLFFYFANGGGGEAATYLVAEVMVAVVHVS